MKFIDITGVRFSRLTAVSYEGGSKWRCLCDCGGTTTTKTGKLKSGHTKSCGCFQREVTTQRNKTHGSSKTKAYNSWRGMKERCNVSSHHYYSRYGGRGIGYAPEWESFEVFYADMGDCPPGLSLDRIDGDANYSKQNCRWADAFEQQNNTRQNVWITFRGETHTVAQWSRILEIPVHQIYQRLRNGWTHERALSMVDATRIKTVQ